MGLAGEGFKQAHILRELSHGDAESAAALITI